MALASVGSFCFGWSHPKQQRTCCSSALLMVHPSDAYGASCGSQHYGVKVVQWFWGIPPLGCCWGMNEGCSKGSRVWMHTTQDMDHSVCVAGGSGAGEDGVRWCAALWLRPKVIALVVAVCCAVAGLAGTSFSISLCCSPRLLLYFLLVLQCAMGLG